MNPPNRRLLIRMIQMLTIGINQNRILIELDIGPLDLYPPLRYHLRYLLVLLTYQSTNKQVFLLALHLNQLISNFIRQNHLIKTKVKSKKYLVHSLSLKALQLISNVKEEEPSPSIPVIS